MNPQLQLLHPYPFARLRELLKDVQPETEKQPISLAVGEPQLPAPEFVLEALSKALCDINRYPLTQGIDSLRESIAIWLCQRYQLDASLISAHENILPLQGSREGLFAIAQVVVNQQTAQQPQRPLVLLPSPFYQIYEGAALLAGAEPVYLPCSAENSFSMDFSAVTEEQWQRCQLLYICSPSNPTGHVASLSEYKELLELAQQYDFVIVGDECYSEIYKDEINPCGGLLQAASDLGLDDFSNCLVFNSLSKRSNLAGMRSGFVAGDKRLIKQFLLYRTYHGSAMPLHHQHASMAAWNDEQHVVENRAHYRASFERVLPLFQSHTEAEHPQGGFCLWLPTPIDDREFAKKLYQQQGVTVLPGSFLARDQEVAGQNINAGKQYVRLALVYDLKTNEDAARRIAVFSRSLV